MTPSQNFKWHCATLKIVKVAQSGFTDAGWKALEPPSQTLPALPALTGNRASPEPRSECSPRRFRDHRRSLECRSLIAKWGQPQTPPGALPRRSPEPLGGHSLFGPAGGVRAILRPGHASPGRPIERRARRPQASPEAARSVLAGGEAGGVLLQSRVIDAAARRYRSPDYTKTGIIISYGTSSFSSGREAPALGRFVQA